MLLILLSTYTLINGYCLSTYELTGCLKADVIVLVDISGSIDGNEDQIHLALVDFVDGLDISDEGIHAGIVAFSDQGKTLCKLTGNHDDFDDTFTKVKSDNGNTNMKQGLMAVMDEYAQRGREDAIKVVIIISDGATQDQPEAIQLAESLILIRALVCSVLIKNTVSDADFMKKLGGNCYMETEYKNLYKELQRLDFCL